MRKLLTSLLLLTVLASLAQPDKVIPPKPVPHRFVVDQTGTLTGDQSAALELKLKAYQDSTSSEIAVAIIPTLDGNDISDVAYKLGRAWGVGSKEFNNGVVILIAKKDRKVYIATGYGLEGAIPDITAKQIVEDEIVPNFRQDDFYRGIDQGIDAIIKAAAGEYTAKPRSSNGDGGGAEVLFFILFILIVLVIIGRKGGRGGGGGFIRGAGLGGSSWTWSSSSGSGWSSGGGGGSFGGGSFGGGGAGGSW